MSSAPDMSLWNLSKETSADLSQEQLHWPRPSKYRSGTTDRGCKRTPQPQALLMKPCAFVTLGVASASPEGLGALPGHWHRSLGAGHMLTVAGRLPSLTSSLESRLWQNPRESHSWVSSGQHRETVIVP